MYTYVHTYIFLKQTLCSLFWLLKTTCQIVTNFSSLPSPGYWRKEWVLFLGTRDFFSFPWIFNNAMHFECSQQPTLPIINFLMDYNIYNILCSVMLVVNAFHLFQNMLFSNVLNEILGDKQEHKFKCYLTTEIVKHGEKSQQIQEQMKEKNKWKDKKGFQDSPPRTDSWEGFQWVLKLTIKLNMSF